MAFIDVDALLAPVSDSSPCGADLEYDAEFLALDEAARGKAEQQFGDTIIPAEEPDWARVQQLALTLLGRSKDLRLAVPLLRAATRLQGLQAAAEGLSLVHGLLDVHWASLYPLLDADDANDPTMRLNALVPLVDPQGFIADLRAATLQAGRGVVKGRDIELAAGKVAPQDGETVLPMAGVQQALRDAEAQQAGLLGALIGMSTTVAAIDTLINERASLSGPEFRPLQLLLKALADVARAVQTGLADAGAEVAATLPGEADASGAPGGQLGAGGLGPLRNRDDAIRALDKVCEWMEHNEPSNPAPLLIRRAQRLMSKNFFDIIRDLMPDGLEQIEKLAGVPADQ